MNKNEMPPEMVEQFYARAAERRVQQTLENATQRVPPTPAEAELLTCLAEECGEVVQRCTKILRFGLESVGPRTTIDNRGLLESELGDLIAVTDALARLDTLSGERVYLHAHAKFIKLTAAPRLFVHAGDALRARLNSK